MCKNTNDGNGYEIIIQCYRKFLAVSHIRDNKHGSFACFLGVAKDKIRELCPDMYGIVESTKNDCFDEMLRLGCYDDTPTASAINRLYKQRNYYCVDRLFKHYYAKNPKLLDGVQPEIRDYLVKVFLTHLE